MTEPGREPTRDDLADCVDLMTAEAELKRIRIKSLEQENQDLKTQVFKLNAHADRIKVEHHEAVEILTKENQDLQGRLWSSDEVNDKLTADLKKADQTNRDNWEGLYLHGEHHKGCEFREGDKQCDCGYFDYLMGQDFDGFKSKFETLTADLKTAREAIKAWCEYRPIWPKDPNKQQKIGDGLHNALAKIKEQ